MTLKVISEAFSICKLRDYSQIDINLPSGGCGRIRSRMPSMRKDCSTARVAYLLTRR